ncbi:MAG: glycoside hydrolase family 2 TIM barrel-domain containing protein [Bacteroidota bacterium]|nr:glycoside hydrolase family 2 TIM barrel-domain containing protein [Bacteroidota bacterium]
MKQKITTTLIILQCMFLMQHSAYSQKAANQLTWKLMPQSDVAVAGEKVSLPGFASDNWVAAIVPGTVFYSYVVAGKEPNPDYADNIYKVDKTKYNKPFWYRTEFATPKVSSDKRIWLNFNGIHKIGTIYFNGHHLGTLKGVVERGKYDITGMVNKGKANAIAVLVSPPINDPEHNHGLANHESPTYVCSAGWDWMPPVPGYNSGITDSVTISTTGAVSVEDPWVRADLPNNNLANLTLGVNLRNALATPVKGVVKAVINPGNITITGPQVTIDANSSKEVMYNQKDFSKLSIKNPELWWPNGYGGKADGTQHLYTCTVRFELNGAGISDASTKVFGIRKITSDTTALNGPMRVCINGVPVLLKGGNWGMSDYMLKVRGADYEPRIRLHKEMNYNVIRNWTGEVTDEAFYDYCDKYGIMVWDDFWLNNFGPIDSLSIFKRNAIEKVKRLRNHPSIVIWCGANEGVPGGDPKGPLNMAIKNAVKDNDGDDKIYIARSNASETNPNFSIHGGSRNLSGSGIWGNVDPKTYFTDPHNGYLFSKDSYGMRSELGAATFVNVESFKKFMPQEYWVPPTTEAVKSNTNMWAKHYFCTDGALGGGSDPVRYINDINSRYGASATIEDFCKKAQLMNVETLKAMYEAWNDHMWNDASGMLIWMSQSAYPTMIWQTYDYYFDLTGAYFGCKTACEPVHIQWNAATNSVKVINNRPYAVKAVTAEAQVYNSDGKVVSEYSQKATLDVNSTSVKEAFVVFAAGDTKPALSDVHFLKLKLFNAQGKLLSENFYWIGNTYLDYTALNKLPSVGASLLISKPVVAKASGSGQTLLTYTITNQSATTAAVGIRAQLLNDKGEQILPAIFDDGYFSLMQGETKTLHVEVDPKILGSKYALSVKAYND